MTINTTQVTIPQWLKSMSFFTFFKEFNHFFFSLNWNVHIV